jgi:hypothetical protein
VGLAAVEKDHLLGNAQTLSNLIVVEPASP